MDNLYRVTAEFYVRAGSERNAQKKLQESLSGYTPVDRYTIKGVSEVQFVEGKIHMVSCEPKSY